ncbi:NAD-dependent epimerase/dehydratase family protein [Sulfolobus acidocaldarius]|uniref:Epimerase n=1 Tax=Sulfolobus acidocaldarius (strain ATCC 33909 / DSM 639 / JCM 8929 / NBRC 15157 / NCIMB 11770) TaxID=330779 RepID=Q4JAP3_SULAC|nr:epimerase [Sulfolobus acidocaldarius DSM 639]
MYVITGGAGYIGGHLVDTLVNQNKEIIVIDNFTNGKYINNKALYLNLDLRGNNILGLKVPKESILYHLAANPDVRDSMTNTIDHFEMDVKATLNILEVARKNDVCLFIFASSSTVYGEPSKIPTPEEEQTNPISNYGIFKLLGEQLVNYYSRVYGIKSIIVRLANVIGGRVTHGVIKDFINKLRSDPNRLQILGNGKQRKSYIYITDVIDGFQVIEKSSIDQVSVYNLGNEDWISVDEIARIVEEELKLTPAHEYVDAGGGRGWPGDARYMLLDITKLKKLGWKPKYSSREAVRLAVRDYIENGMAKN